MDISGHFRVTEDTSHKFDNGNTLGYVNHSNIEVDAQNDAIFGAEVKNNHLRSL